MIRLQRPGLPQGLKFDHFNLKQTCYTRLYFVACLLLRKRAQTPQQHQLCIESERFYIAGAVAPKNV